MKATFMCHKMKWEILFAKDNHLISGDWDERNGFSNWQVLAGENYEKHSQMMDEATHDPLLFTLKETEKRMKEMIAVEDISLLQTNEKRGKLYYLFGFRITSPVAKNMYSLCDTWEDTSNHLIIPEQDDYFMLEALKSETEDSLFEPTDDSHLLKIAHKRKVGKPRLFPRSVRGNRSLGIETHSTFKEDLTKAVTEHPSVRLEMLYV